MASSTSTIYSANGVPVIGPPGVHTLPGDNTDDLVPANEAFERLVTDDIWSSNDAFERLCTDEAWPVYSRLCTDASAGAMESGVPSPQFAPSMSDPPRLEVEGWNSSDQTSEVGTDVGSQSSLPDVLSGDRISEQQLQVPVLLCPFEVQFQTSNLPTLSESAVKHSLPEWATVTTVMMRNLPNKFSQHALLADINHMDFLGKFDFLYLPIDPATSANKGYAFINFVKAEFAWLFKQRYEGRKMNRSNSEKVVSVSPASLQGFEANFNHYANLRVNRGDPACRPLFLRDLAGCRTFGFADSVANVGVSLEQQANLHATHQGVVFGTQVGPTAQHGAGAGSPQSISSALANSPGNSRRSCKPEWPADIRRIQLPLGASEVHQEHFCARCGSTRDVSFRFCPCCGSSV